LVALCCGDYRTLSSGDISLSYREAVFQSHTDLMLIRLDLTDCCHNSRRVESEDRQTDDDARLVTEHRPTEVNVRIERDEAADTDADQKEPGRDGQTHPRLDRSQVRVVVRVEVFQSLDRLTHLDVAHACMQHLNHEDQERGRSFDHAVGKVQPFR